MFGQSKTPFTFNFSSPSTQAGSTQAAGQTGAPAQTTTTTGGGLFGSTQPSTTTTISGSGSFSLSGGFGQAKSTATFGQPASAQPTTSLFGSPFGAKPASSTTTLGSGFGTTPALGSTSAFGTSFGQQASTSTGSTGFPAIAQQPQQPIAQQQITPEVFTSALTNAQVFNDERDAILTKWNQLQACYGFGKLFFQNNSIDVDKDNRYNRFKTIGYSCKPSTRNEDGLVCLIINQKEEMVKTNQKSISDSLHKIFNSDQALIIKIETIKPIEESRTELIFYITKRTSALNEQGERVPAMMVFEHLNKQEPPSGMMSLKTTPSVRQQLEQLNVVHFYPLVGLNDDQVKAYLETPPSGINPLLWDQAKKNNPNAKKLLPVPITGFQEINKRFKLQEQENQAHKQNLQVLNQSIEDLNSRNKLIRTKIEQFKLRNEDLEQRVLKLMINYEIRRKLGAPLQENEKYLLSILDSFQVELNSPINREIRRQKLNDFMDTIKKMESLNRKGTSLAQIDLNESQLGANNLTEIQSNLGEQQKALKSLIQIIKKDLSDMNLIKKELLHEK